MYVPSILPDRVWQQVNRENMSNPRFAHNLAGALTIKAREIMGGIRSQSEKMLAQIEAFATSGDFPTSILPIIEKFRVNTPFDEGWTRIFDVRDMSGTRRSGFKILDVADGLTFYPIQAGDHVRLAKMGGETAEVPFVEYAGGLQWFHTLIDDEEYWTLEDNTIAFIRKAAARRASDHYALVEAIPNTRNIAWQAPLPALLPNTDANYVAIRDMRTITAAIIDIITGQASTSVPALATDTFTILSPLQLADRAIRARGLLNGGIAGQLPGVNFNTELVITNMLTTTNVMYVCLPGRKAKSGNRQDLIIKSVPQPMALSDAMIGSMRYGGAIGDTGQFRRLASA